MHHSAFSHTDQRELLQAVAQQVEKQLRPVVLAMEALKTGMDEQAVNTKIALAHTQGAIDMVAKLKSNGV